MSKPDIDVLVVGAGPTGLTLANELARHKVSFRIVDKNPTGSDKSKALAVHSRSLEMLEDMGIVERFLSEGIKIKGVNIFADTKQIAKISLDELDSQYQFALSLPQSRTESLLEERLKELGGTVERSSELTAIVDEDGIVTSTIVKDGQIEEIKSRWLVGCDGAHSAVRHALDLDFEGKKYPDLIHLGDLKIEGDMVPDEIYVYTSSKGLVAFFPYGGGRYRLAADMGEHKEPEEDPAQRIKPDPSLELLQQLVDERAPSKLTLSEMHWSTSLYLHCRHVSRYRVGNCFLAGDAAHIHSPAGGQGMNTGMQDGYNLAWKLSLVAKNASGEQILQTYESERLAIAIGVLKLTDFMMKVNTMKNPVGQQIRNRLAPILTAQEVIQKRVKGDIAELSLNYRKSSIVEEHQSSVMNAVMPKKDMPDLYDIFEFKHGPSAGDRAPDGFLVKNVDKTTRLHELMAGTKHALLLFSGNMTSDAEVDTFRSIANIIKTSYASLIKLIVILDSPESEAKCASIVNEYRDVEVQIYTDFEMSCHHQYGAGSNCMYLIRPDKYVGFRSQPIDALLLLTYLLRIFDRMKVQTKV